MSNGKLLSTEVYLNLVKYYEKDDWHTKARMISTLTVENRLAGDTLFLRGDKEPQLAYFVANGSVGLYKGKLDQSSNIYTRENIFEDSKLCCSVMFQIICQRLDESFPNDHSKTELPSTKFINKIHKSLVKLNELSSCDKTGQTKSFSKTTDYLFKTNTMKENSQNRSSSTQMIFKTKYTDIEELMAYDIEYAPLSLLTKNLANTDVLNDFIDRQDLIKASKSKQSIGYLLSKLMEIMAFRTEVVGKVHGDFIIAIESGGFFGERIFGRESQRTVTATTMVPTTFFVVNKAGFERTFLAAIEEKLSSKKQILIDICPELSQFHSKQHIWNIIYAARITDHKQGEVIYREGHPTSSDISFILGGSVNSTRTIHSSKIMESASDDFLSQFYGNKRQTRDVMEGIYSKDLLKLVNIEKNHAVEFELSIEGNLIVPLEKQSFSCIVSVGSLGLLSCIGLESLLRYPVHTFGLVVSNPLRLLSIDRKEFLKYFPRHFISKLVREFLTLVPRRLLKARTEALVKIKDNDKKMQTVNRELDMFELVTPSRINDFRNRRVAIKESELHNRNEELAEEVSKDSTTVRKYENKTIRYKRQVLRETKVNKLLKNQRKLESKSAGYVGETGASKDSEYKLKNRKSKIDASSTLLIDLAEHNNQFPWTRNNYKFNEQSKFALNSQNVVGKQTLPPNPEVSRMLRRILKHNMEHMPQNLVRKARMIESETDLLITQTKALARRHSSSRIRTTERAPSVKIKTSAGFRATNQGLIRFRRPIVLENPDFSSTKHPTSHKNTWMQRKLATSLNISKASINQDSIRHFTID